MKKINMHEAKTHLSRIVESVAHGETVVIAKAGKPMAILSPYKQPNKVRKPGALRGKIRIADDFDEVDDLISNLFHSEHGKD
jgi:prevent-host-death family protein